MTEYTLEDLAAAQQALKLANERMDNHRKANPTKHMADASRALVEVYDISLARKRTGLLPRTPAEEISWKLDQKHPDAESKQVAVLEGRLYQKRYSPVATSNSGKTVLRWAHTWAPLPTPEPPDPSAPPVFCFGSNSLKGIHGAGAALFAAQHRGAVKGIGEGHVGNSYAIPTKLTPRETLPLPIIERHVQTFLLYAEANPEYTFQVTPIGCGLAGYTPEQIAPFFADAPDNCQLPEEFLAVLADRPRP
ncbi:hypothetical protein LJR168_003805 [Pseudoxanthomonas sp. LjRoot168]|uniref:A1S_2505 family phage non-structural protein n=1 Tax=unclassified Pseudoxanthomonas TaxID=2645906 RepID=UPI003ED1277E